MKSIYLITLIIFTLFFSACSNNTNLKPDNNKTTIKNSRIEQLIAQDNLDAAGEEFISLKEAQADNKVIKNAAKKLAIAHMAKKEHILANFFIQEAISSDESDDSLKLLLIKNQYLAAIHNSTDLSYLQKALKALEENINLIVDENNKIEANRMLQEVKELVSKKNREIANYYKIRKKDSAYELYNSRAEQLNQEPNSIDTSDNIVNKDTYTQNEDLIDNSQDVNLEYTEESTIEENIQ